MHFWKKLLLATILVLTIALAQSATADVETEMNGVVELDEQEDADEVDEIGTMETDVSKLPEIVSAAAQGAKENFSITGFRQETEIGQVVYDVFGLAGDLCYEIEVTENGQVLEIENCD